MAKILKLKKSRDFFVKGEESIYIVQRRFIKDIVSRQAALVIAMRTYAELCKILADEVKTGPLFIGNLLVAPGLQRGLDELEKRFPFLMHEILSLPSRRFCSLQIEGGFGTTIATC